MRRPLSLLAAALFVPAWAIGAGTRDYQVTGPVLDVTPDSITVEKDKEKWEIARTKDTKIDNVFGNAGFDSLFMEDRVQDNYNGTLGADFFRLESNPNTGQPLDVLVPDQT